MDTPGATMAAVAAARAVAGAVVDPEIPVVTLLDLGILRDVQLHAGQLRVTLTPTYTGCPATQVIEQDVRAALAAGGWPDAQVRTVLSPPWTTDWITPEGRQKLRAYGIAPPGPARVASAPIRLVRRGESLTAGAGRGLAALAAGADRSLAAGAGRGAADHAGDTGAPHCPRCDSPRTERLAEYGSTACKSLYRCLACREPFDYFKPY